MGGSGPSHERVGEYQFHDPAGRFGQGMDAAQTMTSFGQDQFSQQMEPGAFMNRFQHEAEGMANLAQGATSPLQQQLNALAAEQSQRGLDMASTEMAGMGALHSGAAQRAMGQAMATPFAEAQAQIGQQQVGLTGQLMQQAGQRQNLEAQLASQLWGQGAGQMGQMGMHTSALEAPMIMTDEGASPMQGAISGGLGGAASGASLGAMTGTPFGVGAGAAGGALVGGLGGFFSP